MRKLNLRAWSIDEQGNETPLPTGALSIIESNRLYIPHFDYYTTGLVAFRKGVQRSANPFVNERARAEWDAGWLKAHDIHRYGKGTK